MDNMSIQSTHDVGDKVWVFRNEDGKFYEGTVNEIQSWDKWNGFRYDIIHHGESEIRMNIEERFVFSSREEIINTRFIAEVNE